MHTNSLLGIQEYKYTLSTLPYLSIRIIQPFSQCLSLEHFAETCITRRVVINVPQLQYKHSGGSLFHAQSADFWQDHHCWGKECCVYYFPAQSTPVISHPGPNLAQVVLIIKTCCVFD